MTKTFPWLYRILFGVFAILFSFTTVYTVSLFTPGLVEGSYGYDCPSAFSNPTPKVTNDFQQNLNEYADDLTQSLKIVDRYPVKDVKDPVVKAINLRKFLLDSFQYDLDTSSNPEYNKVRKQLSLNTCSYDRAILDESFLDAQADAEYEKVWRETGDEQVASVFAGFYEDDRDPFQRYLTIKTVSLLWLATIALGILIFFIGRKITPYERINRVIRIAATVIAFGFCLYITLGPIIAPGFEEDVNGSKCQITDAFEKRKSPSFENEIGSFAFRSIETTLTKTSEKAIADMDVKLTKEQQQEFTKQNEVIRDEAKKLYKEFEYLPTYKNYVINDAKASSECVSQARNTLLFPLFGITLLTTFSFFMWKSKKNKTSTPIPRSS